MLTDLIVKNKLEVVDIHYIQRYLEMKGYDVIREEETAEYHEYVGRKEERDRIIARLIHKETVGVGEVREFKDRIIEDIEHGEKYTQSIMFGKRFNPFMSELTDYGIEAHYISTFDLVANNFREDKDHLYSL